MSYTFSSVFVARTFPEVVFTYWGGIRYVLGLATVLCLIKFVRTQRWNWGFVAGLLSGLLMTSVERIGVLHSFGHWMCLCLGIFFYRSMDRHKFLGKAALSFLGGLGLVLGVFGIYMVKRILWFRSLESVYAVVPLSHPTFATFDFKFSPNFVAILGCDDAGEEF